MSERDRLCVCVRKSVRVCEKESERERVKRKREMINNGTLILRGWTICI